MKRIAYILFIAGGFASCKGSDKISSAGNEQAEVTRKKPVCGKLHVDMNEPHLDWYEENSSVLNKSTELLVLPKDYKVYSVDSAQLNRFFKAIANNKTVKTVVPLPKPADCQLFTVKSHTYMPTRKLMPNAITAKGLAKGQELVLGYDNGLLDGFVSWFEIDYQIITKYVQGKPYLIVYTKQQLPAPAEEAKKKSPQKQEMAPTIQYYTK